MDLKIGEGLSLPLETVTQTIGIVAKKRVGKSYTMRRIVEQLLINGQQVVLVDPKGDQWGVRSSANGKSPGQAVTILGGERGDVPLGVNSGEIVAKLVVEERVSVLLDLSIFRKYEIATFMTGFMENFYRMKAKESFRTPVMLVIDEADAIAPQRPQKGEERMLGAAEDIVRRGGQRGIGCVLVTQRAAVLNKNVLTQVQMLIALRTIAPQDLQAMNAWIEVHGTIEQQKIMMESLPSLPVGDAWFWSPGWPSDEGIFKRSHVFPIETFDSGATPKPGEKRLEPKAPAKIDLDILRKQMADVIQKAKENDPDELKKRIRELEKKVKDAEKLHHPHDDKKLMQLIAAEKAKWDALQSELLKSFRAAFEKKEHAIEKILKICADPDVKDKTYIPQMSKGVTFSDLKKTKEGVTAHIERFNNPIIPVDAMMDLSGKASKPVVSNSPDNRPFSKPEKTILSFLASNSERSFTDEQIAAMTGYNPRTSSFLNGLYFLNNNGWITREEKMSRINKIPDGIDLKMEFNLTNIRPKLNNLERQIFDLLIASPDQKYTDEQIAANVPSNYNPRTSSFLNALYHLNSIGIIERVRGVSQLSKSMIQLL